MIRYCIQTTDPRETDTRDTEAPGLPEVLHRRGLALRMAAEGQAVALASRWEEPGAPRAGWAFPPSGPVVLPEEQWRPAPCRRRSW